MRFYPYFLVVLGIASTLLPGCAKDDPTIRVVTRPVVESNTPPQAYAGRDAWVMLPASTTILNGGAGDKEGNFDKWLWRQVSGPGSSLIENPDSSRAQVSNLQKGTYAFELTVTDKGGLTGKDTVAVSVVDPAPPGRGEVIFKDLPLNCPMGCHLAIDCIFCTVPVNQPLKIYLREVNSSLWTEVVPEAQWTGGEKYLYYIFNGNLVIYTNDEPNYRVDVKITY